MIFGKNNHNRLAFSCCKSATPAQRGSMQKPHGPHFHFHSVVNTKNYWILTTSRMISCRASSSDCTARFSLLRTKTRSCSFSNNRRTFFMLSQPTPWPSRTLCTTSFRNCWFSLNHKNTFSFNSGVAGNHKIKNVIRSANHNSIRTLTWLAFLILRQKLCTLSHSLPCVVDSTLRRWRFSLHCWTVFYHWRFLVHKSSGSTCTWRNWQNTVSEPKR